MSTFTDYPRLRDTDEGDLYGALQDCVQAGVSVPIRWLRGHSGWIGNELADSVAVWARDRLEKEYGVVSRFRVKTEARRAQLAQAEVKLRESAVKSSKIHSNHPHKGQSRTWAVPSLGVTRQPPYHHRQLIISADTHQKYVDFNERQP